MRFALSPEQRQFAASIDDLLGASDVPKLARSWAAGDTGPGRRLWQRLAELGVPALAVPEPFGGLDADPVDLVVAVTELGRHPVPGPVVESIAAVPVLLATTDAAADWLPGLADGSRIASLAAPPHLPYALDGDLADPLLVLDGDTLRLGEADGPVQRSVDPARRLFAVRPVGEPLGPAPATRRAFDLGALCCAAQLLGAGRALVDLATRYAGQRRQFGRPIGVFQAVKHQLADVLVGLELAQPLLYGAAVTMSSRDVSAAKVACGQAAYRAARTALQVHGAIGYTEEYDLGLWLTKIRALVSAWGTAAHHRCRVLEALCGRT